MSRMGNYYREIQETEDYRFGYQSAARGEPLPDWSGGLPHMRSREEEAQRLGWQDYHDEQVRP